MKNDFISIYDYSREWFEEIFKIARDLKNKIRTGEVYHPLKDKTLTMIFQKSSARTRISFEMGMYQLGGYALYLAPDDIQLGKRESVKDIARVISRYNDCIMARLFDHKHIIELAEYSSVPVINGLTNLLHPCQVTADIFTILEYKGVIDNIKVAFIGDGNNVANSWLNMSSKFPLNMSFAIPEGYDPNQEILERALNSKVSNIQIFREPFLAAEDADVIYTDVWTSMGKENEIEKRKIDFKNFQVNEELLKFAKDDCVVMHCLPAHRGEEITDDVIDGNNSIVYDEAENRMHIQKAILIKLLT